MKVITIYIATCEGCGKEHGRFATHEAAEKFQPETLYTVGVGNLKSEACSVRCAEQVLRSFWDQIERDREEQRQAVLAARFEKIDASREEEKQLARNRLYMNCLHVECPECHASPKERCINQLKLKKENVREECLTPHMSRRHNGKVTPRPRVNVDNRSKS